MACGLQTRFVAIQTNTCYVMLFGYAFVECTYYICYSYERIRGDTISCNSAIQIDIYLLSELLYGKSDEAVE